MREEVGEEGESSTVQNQLSLVVTACHYVPYCSQSWSLEEKKNGIHPQYILTRIILRSSRD